MTDAQRVAEAAQPAVSLTLDRLQEALLERHYVGDRALLMSLFLALRLGKPLLLEQGAVALSRGEQLARLGERAEVIGAGAAVLADELLLARCAGLAEEALRCAQAASVLGTRFRPDHAAEMAPTASSPKLLSSASS